MQPPRKAVQLVELEVINGLSWWFYLFVLYTETKVCTPPPLQARDSFRILKWKSALNPFVAPSCTQDKVQRAHSGMNHSPHSSGLIFGFYSLHVLSGFQVFGNLFSAWNHHAHLSSSYLALQPG